MIDPTAFIHPMACAPFGSHPLHGEISIGARSKVWQFASVIRNASIGTDCVIANCAIVDASYLGDDVHVSPGAVIFPGAHVSNRVFIGPNVVLCNDFWPSVDKEGWDYEALLTDRATSVLIHPDASIGANATIMPGVTIGDGAMIAAGAVVTKDIPRECLYGRDGSISPIKGTPRRMRTC
jgi:acetyltransferase-like isoleucine patch superfamily enzyme